MTVFLLPPEFDTGVLLGCEMLTSMIVLMCTGETLMAELI